VIFNGPETLAAALPSRPGGSIQAPTSPPVPRSRGRSPLDCGRTRLQLHRLQLHRAAAAPVPL